MTHPPRHQGVTVPGLYGFAAQGEQPDSVAQEMRASARRRLQKSRRLQREADRARAEAIALHEAAGPGTRWLAVARRLDALVEVADALTVQPALYDEILAPGEIDELVAERVSRIGGHHD